MPISPRIEQDRFKLFAADAFQETLPPNNLQQGPKYGANFRCGVGFGYRLKFAPYGEATPAMNNPMLPLPGLSPVGGKTVVAKFDGGLLSSDGGVLVLREVEQRLRVADRLAACIDRSARAGADHAHARRHHPLSPADDRRRLRGRQRRQQPARRSDVQDGARSLAVGPRSVFAVDDLAAGESAGRSRPAAHGPRHGRPLLRVVPPGSQAHHARHRRHVRRRPRRPAIAAVQCPLRRIRLSADRRVRRRGPLRHRRAASRQTARAARRSAPSCAACCARSAANWPKTEILLRADSHYCAPEVLDFCRANGLDFILGVAPTTTLRRAYRRPRGQHEGAFEAAPKDGKVRRFKEFFDGAQSWSRVERIIARVEAGADGPDTRFVVTNLTSSQRRARSMRMSTAGAARPKTTSSPGRRIWRPTARPARRPRANQFRLFLHAGAYWLMWGLRAVDAAALDVARRAVRHAAPAPDQDRRARRRDEDDDQGSLADIVSRTGHPALRARTYPASRHLSGGA